MTLPICIAWRQAHSSKIIPASTHFKSDLWDSSG